MTDITRGRRALDSEELIDRLAAIEHDRWSHWQRYVHDQATRQPDGALLLPAETVARWEKQIRTAYADLSSEERASDREQVERYLPTIRAALDDKMPA